jgi:hypothetical protein
LGTRSPEQVLGKLPQAGREVDKGEKLPVDFFRYIHELPINGDPPVEVVPDESTGPAVRIPPLAQNYDLLWTKVDLTDSWRSYAHLKKKTGTDVANVKLEVMNYKAVFRSDEGEDVTLEAKRTAPATFETTSGEGKPDVPDTIGAEKKEKATKESGPLVSAIEERENFWNVPKEEVDYWDEFGESVAEDVAVLPVTDPETKKAVGIQVKTIAKGSIVARRGVKQGDILKSINGQPVGSRQEAVNYFKGPGKGLTRYKVVIERNGRDITITYNVKAQ